MFRRLYGLIGFGMLLLHSSAIFGQAIASPSATSPCDKTCKQVRVDALFKAMEDAEVSQRPRASSTTVCAAYDGHDDPNVLKDVCAKLKYVRSLPIGTDTRFSCPSDTASLIGVASNRIRALWGRPDQLPDKQLRRPSDALWTYFIGNTKPGEISGGFPELSIYIVNGMVTSVSCDLSQ